MAVGPLPDHGTLGNGLQVDFEGLGLPRACPSWVSETELLTSWPPLNNVILALGAEGVLLQESGVAEDDGW